MTSPASQTPSGLCGISHFGWQLKTGEPPSKSHQPDEKVLKAGRDVYTTDPEELIASSHVVAIEFATIAAANNYWR